MGEDVRGRMHVCVCEVGCSLDGAQATSQFRLKGHGVWQLEDLFGTILLNLEGGVYGGIRQRVGALVLIEHRL